MKIYKFGGASVQSSDGVKNTAEIIRQSLGDLIVVISAMGKTTDALGEVLDAYMSLHINEALAKLKQSKQYHLDIVKQLFPDNDCGLEEELDEIYGSIIKFMSFNRRLEYDYCYDQIVPIGEVTSTRIISTYLNHIGTQNIWIDARKIIKTDSVFRDANVRLDESSVKLHETVDFSRASIYITQGFIGSNPSGETTTLGREGSDYTAALLSSFMNAENLTIWKDVEGVLSADPRFFSNVVLLSSISYKEAAELSYYGAQVLHPKTIKPLHNKNIPLYVKSFIHPDLVGTIVSGDRVQQRETPVFILKRNQVLVSILSKDFSFALEETLVEVFNLLLRNRLKVNLIQSSALSISVCIDDTRRAKPAIEELMTNYEVRYNNGVELLTIRNYTDELIEQSTLQKQVYLTQKTRRTVRIIHGCEIENNQLYQNKP